MVCYPAPGPRGTLGGASRHSRRRGRGGSPRGGAQARRPLLPPATRRGPYWGSGVTGQPGVSPEGNREPGGRGAQEQPGASARRGDAGEVPRRLGGPEQPVTPPPGAPRAARAPSPEASRTTRRGRAAASRPPSYSLRARPGRAPPPRHLPRAAAPPPSSPPPGGPARSPGSPRSPALDNALVKTAELFLTSPPPLLIKAPP